MTQLTIFKIHPDITDPDSIVANQRRPWAAAVRIPDAGVAILHLRRSSPKPPAWLDFFPEVDFAGVNPVVASTGAVLVVQRPTGFFAVVFGFGRYLLAEGVTDERFGLRVVLNAMEPTQLRSLDHKRLESVPRTTREQLSKAGSLGQFGLDVERDLLRGLTAIPKDRNLGERMSGTDALAVTGSFTLAQLPTLLDAYDALAARADYLAVFPWVDNVAQVRDKRLVRHLDEALVAAMKAGSDLVWLAIPEIVDWANVAGFRYKGSKQAPMHDDLALDSYYAECGSPQDMTTTRLASDFVRCVRADDGLDMYRWAIRRCIVAEIVVGAERHILSEGQWFRADPNFLSSLDSFIASLGQTAVQLPRFAQHDEGEYVERVARRSSGEMHMLHEDLVQYAPRGSIEVCDLYDRRRIFIHVKRYGGSTVLSHLIAQGSVSAELFSSEVAFRRAVSEKLPAPYRWGDPMERPSTGQFEVCFAVVARPGKPLNLPLFTKINLRKESRRLDQLGFRVSLVAIPS